MFVQMQFFYFSRLVKTLLMSLGDAIDATHGER